MNLDALVIGGGLQGLLVLDRLSSAGFSCALVTPSELGCGQTLHSHGILNTGFGLAGPEPVRALREVVLPDLKRRGVRTYGEWGAVSPAMPPGGEALVAPAGMELRGKAFVKLAEVNVDKRELIAALAHGLEDRILRGSVVGFQRGTDGSIRTVEIGAPGDRRHWVIGPAAVMVASGTGSKAVLRSLGAGENQIADIKHRRVHVLCVRGRSSAIPSLNLVALEDMLFVAGYEHDGVTTYLATPMQFGGPHVEEVPNDASADVDEEFAQRGWEALFRVLPGLGTVSGLQFATYAGFRQDIGDQPGVPSCERMETVPNVVAALPSGLLGAWKVAGRAVQVVAEITPPRWPQPAIPGATEGVRVGESYEDTIGIGWGAASPAQAAFGVRNRR